MPHLYCFNWGDDNFNKKLIMYVFELGTLKW
jgi:hypothetical protein